MMPRRFDMYRTHMDLYAQQRPWVETQKQTGDQYLGSLWSTCLYHELVQHVAPTEATADHIFIALRHGRGLQYTPGTKWGT